MELSEFQAELRDLLRGRFPYIYVVSWEEDRVLEEILRLNGSKDDIKTPRTIYEWTLTEGLIKEPYSNSPEVVTKSGKDNNNTLNKNESAFSALDYIQNLEEPALFILKDFHIYFGSGEMDQDGDPFIVRKIRDLSYSLRHKKEPQNIVFVSPTLRVHQDIEKIVSVLDFPLPDYKQISELLGNMVAANQKSKELVFSIDVYARERLVKAALGMTLQEAENAFAKAIISNGGLSSDDVSTIIEEKSQAIKRSGILEYVSSDMSLDKIGGLENLKQWLEKRRNSWLDAADEYSLPAPKGVLITGVPGCGKSLTAKGRECHVAASFIASGYGAYFLGLAGKQ